MKSKINIVWSSLITIFFLSACATYYQKRISFQNDFAGGNLAQAKSFLEKNKKAAEKKDRLLYFFDRGVVEQMLGNYAESNQFFEKAYTFHQDYEKNFSSDLGTYFVNPMTKPYEGEDFEIVLVHFYKALNYIHLNDLNAALVEVRRINIQLNEFNTQYEDKKNRYKVDAFSLVLMGLIYEAKREYNDAFIAYRNAYEAYQNIYQKYFNTTTPRQLKVDLLRMAKKNGFYQELDRYKKEFQMKYDKSWDSRQAELVFFWLNGLGPVKGEFSITLTKAKGAGGVVTFSNEQEGITLPVYTGNYSSENAAKISDLGFVRLTLPKYRDRIPFYQSASLITANKKYELQKAEDVSEIAYSTLEDRKLRELGQSIARLALKQATEAVAREQNENIGAAVSLLNAVTEKADTRNWQTLPNSIYYQRIPLDTGMNQVTLITYGKTNKTHTDTTTFNFQGNKRMLFETFHTLGSSTPTNINP